MGLLEQVYYNIAGEHVCALTPESMLCKRVQIVNDFPNL